MGAVVTAIVSAVASSFSGFSFAGFLSQRLLGSALSFGLSSLSRNIAGKPKASTRRSVESGLTQTIRQAVTERRIVYGTQRVGGTMVALGTGNDQKYLYMAVVLASHEVTAIDTIYLNDEPIYPDMIGGGGIVASGTYANVVRIEKILGSDTQNANANMLSEITDWTSAHRLRGVAYVYVRLEYNRDAFPGGIPNISAVVRGKKLYDPRDGQTKFSDNPALCVYDYLRDSRYGRNVDTNDLEESFFTAAANICEEMVPCLSVAANAISVNATTDELVLEGSPCAFQTGDRVQIASTGTYPGGLAAATDYFIIVTRENAFVDDAAPQTRVKLAASFANAFTATSINLSSTGSGTLTLTKNAEPRYSCNGVVVLDRQPSDILNDLVASMAGRLVYIGGKWRIFAGAWQASSFTFVDSDFVAPIVVQTRRSRRDRYNAMKGQYAGPQSFYQPTDYPGVKIASYVTEDNGQEIFGQLDLGFTTRSQSAQRIARIAIERMRREITCQIETNLRGMAVQAGDVIAVTHARFGWTNKTFEVLDWTLAMHEQDGAPLLTVRMNLIELDATVFAYNYATDEQMAPAAPRTTLPNPLRVAAPTALVAESGDAHLYVRQDGTVFSRILVSWTAATGPIDRYEVQYRETSAAAWQRPLFVSSDQDQVYVLEAQEGQEYEIRVRSIASGGASSPWVTITHTVDGKTSPPDDIEQFFANANGNVVYFSWKKVTDRDIAGYEIRYDVIGTTSWDNAVIIKVAERGNELTTAAIPPGSWTFFIKALDTSGNYSINARTANAVITNTNTVIAQQSNHPDWLGSKTHMLVHWPSGKLVPQDQEAASANDFDTFDIFLQTPYSDYSYETPEMDLGTALSGNARVWMDITGGVNSFTTPPGALFDYDSSLDTRISGAYDGYEPWDIGERGSFRYIKARFDLIPGYEHSYFSRGRVVVDAQSRTETRTVTVTGGSSAIAFLLPFLTAPLVRVSNAEGNTNIAGVSAVSTTGFTATLLTPGGANASGNVTYDATGV